MAIVTLTVTVDTHEHSFVENAAQAKALIENLLQRDPRYHTCSMKVSVLEVHVEHKKSRSRETAGDELNNIFNEGPPPMG